MNPDVKRCAHWHTLFKKYKIKNTTISCEITNKITL